MKAERWMALAAVVVSCPCGYGEHRPPLPRRQHAQYESGSVVLREMQIGFAATPDAEDQFAAGQLRLWLRKENGRRVSIVAYGNQPDGVLPIVAKNKWRGDQDGKDSAGLADAKQLAN